MGVLNINNGGGGGSYIRFMPSANAWVFDKQEVTLTQIVVDHDSVKSGWGKMSEGTAPEWQWDERLGVQGPIPSQERDAKGALFWKRGFSIRLFTKTTGAVEWSSTGTGPCIGFDAAFEEVWNARAANAGKVAVLEYTGSTPMKVGKGSTRVPNFKLIKWVDRAAIPWDAEALAAKPAAPAAPPPPPASATVDDDIAF